jgi:hypothetical protein
MVFRTEKMFHGKMCDLCIESDCFKASIAIYFHTKSFNPTTFRYAEITWLLREKCFRSIFRKISGGRKHQSDKMSLWKNAQKEPQPNFLSKLVHNFYRGKTLPQYLCYFCNLQKYMLKVNNHPFGENSPNLVTLASTASPVK